MDRKAIEQNIRQVLESQYNKTPTGILSFEAIAKKANVDLHIITPIIQDMAGRGLVKITNGNSANIIHKNKASFTKWIMEHFWVPLLVALLVAFITIFYIQPWQRNIQDNKKEQQATP